MLVNTMTDDCNMYGVSLSAFHVVWLTGAMVWLLIAVVTGDRNRMSDRSLVICGTPATPLDRLDLLFYTESPRSRSQGTEAPPARPAGN